MMLFTRKYKPDALCPIRFYRKELDLSAQVKYLGVILDPNLAESYTLMQNVIKH